MNDETERYQGPRGLYSLSVDLEHIISEIEERRKKGHAANKEIVKRLWELEVNLKVLSKEWQQSR
jgi:predicted transcriptional regulator